MTYAPDPAMLAKLGGIAALLAAAPKEATAYNRQPRWLGHLPGQQLFFDSELQLDTDGWAGYATGDPSHQAETSLRYAGGGSIDANSVPYFVLPQPVAWATAQGIHIGDYGVVLSGSKLAFAVFGDFGPPTDIGEASLQLFRDVGHERLQADGSVINQGLGPGNLTIVFPGSGPGHNGILADEAALKAAIAETARAKFIALGGVPDAA